MIDVPKIVTTPPGPKAQELKKKEDDVYAPVQMAVYKDLIIDHAEGCAVVDVDGNKYLDFTSGISVNILASGGQHPAVVKAVQEQAAKMMHVGCFIGTYTPLINLCTKIKSHAPGSMKETGKVWFCNTGAESVEAGLKVARWAAKKLMVISFEGGFHGRTVGTMPLTADGSGLRQLFAPLNTGSYIAPYPYCYRCRFGQAEVGPPGCGYLCVEHVKTMLDTYVPRSEVAALVVEPIQGEAGIVIPPREAMQKLKKLCEENGFLWVSDEVWMAWGRTGKWFATEHNGIEPDIITFAKAAGGSLPLGGIIVSKNVSDKLTRGMHGTTFGGNPLSCVAGLTTLETVERENLLERSTRLGEKASKRVKEMAEKIDLIGDARVIGLAMGIELVEDRKTKQPVKPERIGSIMQNLFKRGIIAMHPGGWMKQTLRFAPPLTIPEEQLFNGLDMVEEELKKA
jgi:4-aminobutyrate aminotransferase